MFFGLLSRSIFLELAKVFLLSLVAITGIIVLAAVVVEASQKGLGPFQILAAIPLLVPSMMPFIIPPTTLFASCVVYGRLSHDNEIIAIKSAGINVLHVVWPGVLLGLTMSVTTLVLFYYLIPHTHLMLRTAVANDLQELVYSFLRKDGQFRGRSGGGMRTNYEIYVGGVQGHLLKTAIFKRRNPQTGEYDLIAKAREAELKVDLARNEVVVHMRDGHCLDASGRGVRGYFLDQEEEVELQDLETKERSSRDMTWQELLQARIDLKVEMEKTTSMIALLLAHGSTTKGAAVLAEQRKHLSAKLRSHVMRMNNLNTELHMRPALSFGCLFFVLVGCPVGIWFSRSDYLSAFITCFMPIVFIYYPIQLCCTNFAKDGKVHPAMALWAANAALALMAVGLFRRLLKN